LPVPAFPDIAYDNRWPITGADSALPISDNVTYTRGAHIFKAGILRDTNVSDRLEQALSLAPSISKTTPTTR
jgi:hypothetical protein